MAEQAMQKLEPIAPDHSPHGTRNDLQKGAVQQSLEAGGSASVFALKGGDAAEAATVQTRMSLLKGLKQYPKAAAWSILLSTTIVMLAYDTALLGNFYAYPSFQKKYGIYDGKGYQVPASWQSGLSNGSNVGGIIGLLLNGILADRFGHKRVTLGALVATIGFVFILFFAPDLATLEAGEILCGIPWGMYQGLTTAYASEVVPVVMRQYLTSYIQLCWVFGHLLGSGVLRALLSRTDKWGYKIPFGLQWMWPVPLIIGLSFAPQSPWYYVRRNRLQDAERSLRKLMTRPLDSEIRDTVDLMIRTNEMEKEIQVGTSYLDCFRAVDLRRTEIVTMAYLIQYLSGNGLTGYSAYFFEQAGFSPSKSFDLTMAQYAIGIFGLIISWSLMARFGRRTLWLVGLVLSSMFLMIIGFLGLASSSNSSADWAKGALLILFFFVHSVFIGPLLYATVGEMPSTRLRQKSIVLAACAYSIMGIVNSTLTPHMLNPTSWNWGAKAGFFWAGLCILSTVWAYFRLPEGKDRTYAELDVLFANRVSARKFTDCIVDINNGSVEVVRDGRGR